jgi:adenylate kinase family enzyme
LTSAAAAFMRAAMQRIAIVGCSGGGKSTLARALGARLGLPVVHMDMLFWRPGWTESPIEEFLPKVEAAAAQERWIIEGGYTAASALRFARADVIVWIEAPRWLCLWRAFARMALNFGRSRADLAPGCPEQFDLAFYRFIWGWDRTARPRMQAAIDRFAVEARLIRLHGDHEIKAFLAGLEPSGPPGR